MNELLDFYDGAYPGAEIDAAIGKVVSNTLGEAITPTAVNSGVTITAGGAFKIGNVVFVDLTFDASAAIPGSGSNAEIMRFPGAVPAISATKMEIKVAANADHTFYLSRVNTGSGYGRLYANEAIPAATGYKLKGMYLT